MELEKSLTQKKVPSKEETAKLESEMNFMLKALLIAKERKKFMTNLPNEIFTIYRENAIKLRSEFDEANS